MTGRTEKAIVTETRALNGVEPEGSFEAFSSAFGKAARTLELAMREHGEALPGATGVIAAFAREGYVQSVVTGNIRSIAVTKLEALMGPFQSLKLTCQSPITSHQSPATTQYLFTS